MNIVVNEVAVSASFVGVVGIETSFATLEPESMARQCTCSVPYESHCDIMHFDLRSTIAIKLSHTLTDVQTTATTTHPWLPGQVCCTLVPVLVQRYT